MTSGLSLSRSITPIAHKLDSKFHFESFGKRLSTVSANILISLKDPRDSN
jgi:hypothetical protein